jgi:arylsulfatase A-like enzyme
MKYTKPIFSIIGSGIISSSISAEVVAKVVAQRPNVIFILADDHAKTAISAYGGINSALAPTPNIDKIANEGVMFNNMFCTNSISGPSRACLITGKYSNVNGFYQNEGGIVFDNSQPTIATILQTNGYNTALIGKWHLFSEPKGFDFYKIHANQSQQGTYWNPLFDTNGKKAIEKGYATNITTNSAIEWMKNRRQKDKPFLLLLNFKAPHRPWEPDSIYQHLFDSVQFPFPETFNDDYNTREKTAGKSMATISKDLSRLDLKQIPPAEMNENEQREWLKFGGTGENQLWTPDKKLEGQALKNWKFQQYIKDSV